MMLLPLAIQLSKMNYRPIFILIFLLSLLSACAHKTTLKSVEFKTHQETLSPLNNWKLSGKLGIKTTDESGSVNIKWTQAAESYDIQLTGPLGQKSIHIEGNNQQVSLKEKGKPEVRAHSAEELIREVTGWKLPLVQLNYWIRGLPAPDTKIKNIKDNGMGLIGTLEQSGWLIEYASYHHMNYKNQLIYLPQKVTARFNDFRLTLIVREWTLKENDNP
jgi:outer membrane lipoprotein LolB